MVFWDFVRRVEVLDFLNMVNATFAAHCCTRLYCHFAPDVPVVTNVLQMSRFFTVSNHSESSSKNLSHQLFTFPQLFQDLGMIPGLSRAGKCDLNSKTFQDLYEPCTDPICEITRYRYHKHFLSRSNICQSHTQQLTTIYNAAGQCVDLLTLQH